MKENRFAQGLCFYKIFLFFVFGSLFGSYFEEIQWFIKHDCLTSRHDLLIGPFSTLYGFGMVLFLILLGPKNNQRSIFRTFFYACFIGGIFEFIAGVLAENICHIKFWDYSNLFLNIGGKTSIPIMLIWGLLGTLELKILYPILSNLIEKIPITIGKIITIFLFLFFLFDMSLSYSVFFRMIKRQEGKPPITKLGEYYDQKFNDTFLYNKYPILKGN